MSPVVKFNKVIICSLVEFALQAGYLTAGGFQKRERAQEGTQGHQQVQRSRPAGYESEVEIALQVEGADPPLEVRGRLDGLVASAGRRGIIESLAQNKQQSLQLHLFCL
jgi:hypothetical protein